MDAIKNKLNILLDKSYEMNRNAKIQADSQHTTTNMVLQDDFCYQHLSATIQLIEDYTENTYLN